MQINTQREGKAERKSVCVTFYLLVHSQSGHRAEANWSQELGTPSEYLAWVTGVRTLRPSSVAFPSTLTSAESEAEQPGLHFNMESDQATSGVTPCHSPSSVHLYTGSTVGVSAPVLPQTCELCIAL